MADYKIDIRQAKNFKKNMKDQITTIHTTIKNNTNVIGRTTDANDPMQRALQNISNKFETISDNLTTFNGRVEEELDKAINEYERKAQDSTKKLEAVQRKYAG